MAEARLPFTAEEALFATARSCGLQCPVVYVFSAIILAFIVLQCQSCFCPFAGYQSMVKPLSVQFHSVL